jgi:enoyl-CoA hydratase/carnithine racemase
MSSAISEAAWRWDRNGDGVWTLWFDQPDRHQNVLDAAALEELEARLVEAEGAHTVRGLLIRSAKPAGFCAGVDFKTILSFQAVAEAEAFVRRGQAVLDHLSALEVPSVAVIHGACLGAGLELALACRRRVALASPAVLQIGTPEVQHGLIPAWGAIARLPRLMGPDDGLDLLVSGRLIGYLLARSHHLVDRLAAESDSTAFLELMVSAPDTPRTWTEEEWEAGWNRVRHEVDEQPGDFPEAQLEILALSAIDVAHGSETAREATMCAAGELAMRDAVRSSLAAFLA